MMSENERTPLLHPSSSLPTVVGYEEGVEYFNNPPHSTTRSEIGRNELVRKKKRRRRRFNTMAGAPIKSKLR
ncbi:unnamed protein product [Caenorhabditis bovis]|uniref:Uncharacterized protein n=1 Tax=Caenorhabditis bovis TaxID=2654633 RepID=A0A8S1EHI6_9PELO|nr:unnamed protein product [Caenorhabditis bovis]